MALHSATKYLTGHHDALIGAIVTRDAELRDRLYQARMRLGLSAAPDAAAMLLRGLDSLEVRVRRQTETATELARRLAEHPAVLKVRYPGLGGLISFDVADGSERAVETSTTPDPRTRRRSAACARRWRAATAGRATASRSACCGCRSGSRTSTRSGPTSARRSSRR